MVLIFTWNLKHNIKEQFLNNPSQSTSSRFSVDCQPWNLCQSFLKRSILSWVTLFLSISPVWIWAQPCPYQTTFDIGVLRHSWAPSESFRGAGGERWKIKTVVDEPDEHILSEWMKWYKGGESANKLWDHPKLDQVLSLHGGEVGVLLPLVLLLAGEGTLLLPSLCCSSPSLPTLSAGENRSALLAGNVFLYLVPKPRYFSFFLLLTILSKPLNAPEQTNKILVVST